MVFSTISVHGAMCFYLERMSLMVFSTICSRGQRLSEVLPGEEEPYGLLHHFSTWSDVLLPGEDEPDGLLCQFDDGAELEHLVPILIHKVQHLNTYSNKGFF